METQDAILTITTILTLLIITAIFYIALLISVTIRLAWDIIEEIKDRRNNHKLRKALRNN